MYDDLVEALRLCVKYGRAEDALANAQKAADAIVELQYRIDKAIYYYRRGYVKDCMYEVLAGISPEQAKADT